MIEPIPSNITKEHVLDAMGRYENGVQHNFADSTKYDLVHDGKRFPPKAILGIAAELAGGRQLTPADFKGGVGSKCFRILADLGFSIQLKSPLLGRFVVGKTYSRRKDIHENYGGQEQGGICTPTDIPAIFLFTGQGGEDFGYNDGWDEEGVFRLFGEGQEGNMSFVRGNRAVRDHVIDGRDLFLFESLGKSKGIRFLGIFNCAGYSIESAPDKTATMREAIVFHLTPVTTIQPEEIAPETVSQKPDLDTLRKRAYAAAKNSGQRTSKQSLTTWRERSQEVKDYVLERAKGVCECCNERAPFLRADGSPYLEPHHTHRLADEGPDHPAWVGAICPNCHREIHSGANGSTINLKLQKHLNSLESDKTAD